VNVLVLGGSGYLSGPIASELAAAGHRVTALTRGRRPLPAGVASLVADRADAEGLVRAVEGRPFEAVVDCIAYRPADAAAAVRAFSGRVERYLFISTDFVYGAERQLPIDEDTPTQALSTYGREKAACEDLLLAAWREDGFPVSILRPPHVMGAGGLLGTGSLEGRDPFLLERLAAGAPIVLIEGGTLLIQPVVHRDVGRACVALLGSAPPPGRCYNVAGPDAVTTRTYYDLVAATIGADSVEYLSLPAPVYAAAFPERAPFAQHRLYRTARLEEDTGYTPQTSLRHAIFEMVDWLQQQPERAYRVSTRDRKLFQAFAAFHSALGEALAAEADTG
jgi:nucleoside-diphosphate-sugar epimerase